MNNDRDYVLGTHDEEIARLGLQHRVWRPVVLECWLRAGIAAGHRVLDVGAGPGYATVDLADIVGPTGEVIALERSNKFVRAIEETVQSRSLPNVKIHELDLITDELPQGSYDFSWCRWVATFVSDPALLVQKLAPVMRKGGMSIFHEYSHYLTWRFSPRLPNQEEFARKVAQSWRATGGEPDIGLELLSLLNQNGFALRSVTPRIFSITRKDEMWQWPATFIPIGLARLQELGVIDRQFAAQVNAEFAEANANPKAVMITPLVLEIIAEKL